VSYTIDYEVGDFLFEFTPASGTKGSLVAEYGTRAFAGEVKLGSVSSRSSFVKEARRLYPEDFTIDEIEFLQALNDLALHVDEQIKIREAKEAEGEADEEDTGPVVEPPELGTDAYQNAMKILTSDNVLGNAAKTMRRLGHVGEWNNKKLAFVCAVSARAQLTVQPSTHAQSSAGKNYLWDTVTSLFPPELVFKRTGFSPKALFRTKMSLKHAILYIQEVKGTEDADFSIRTLQSDNVLKWEATEKQPDGSLANVEYEVEGPTVVVQTTTRNHLHPENETRVVPIYLDESAEQTERIIQSELARAAGRRVVSQAREESLKAAWHDAIRLLEPAEVVVPFAERIEVPSQPLRLRRDVPRFIKIIKLVAWLHQYTREKDERERIVATKADFYTALEIVGDSFARAWKSLTPTEETVYSAITSHVSSNLQKYGFKRSHVESALEKDEERIPTTSVKDALRTLAATGFLESDHKRGATGATYTVAKSTNVAGTIKLRDEKNDSSAPPVHSSIREKSGESGVGKPNSMDESESVHSRPFVHSDGERTNGRKRTKGDSSIKKGVGKPKSTDFEGNGRMDKRGEQKKLFGGGSVEYEYSEDD
jgi:hypothetical protein